MQSLAHFHRPRTWQIAQTLHIYNSLYEVYEQSSAPCHYQSQWWIIVNWAHRNNFSEFGREYKAKINHCRKWISKCAAIWQPFYHINVFCWHNRSGKWYDIIMQRMVFYIWHSHVSFCLNKKASRTRHNAHASLTRFHANIWNTFSLINNVVILILFNRFLFRLNYGKSYKIFSPNKMNTRYKKLHIFLISFSILMLWNILTANDDTIRYVSTLAQVMFFFCLKTDSNYQKQRWLTIKCASLYSHESNCTRSAHQPNVLTCVQRQLFENTKRHCYVSDTTPPGSAPQL